MSDANATGTRPEGATDERTAAAAVRQMFSDIAPRYDLLNHLLSLNIDKLWWRRTARAFSGVLARPDARVLDLCCGTGDMALALLRESGRRGGSAHVVGADFSHPMLARAREKFAGRSAEAIEADALTLPLAGASFDLVTSAFGFRNLANYDKGLREIHRVLRPGGEVGILDFGEPRGLVGGVYRIYFRRVLPAVGTMISGVRGAYSYLPASVERFPDPEEMLARMRAAGFQEVSWTPYSFGIAGLYRGKK
ncbi:MAG TPA: bifunctional demethylmenaquinone methyltransferase/2-methoxy-6-polyprenyl-1,4-benzoquinol methylase UbiE [Terriglobales bacterium]|nr:bifunctional demethylmenaquinone methyltransferase/2-methoxy-6-polyprenyl-1,4-benzoquinol methylase UbiE [Terriglobales bacterium]